jgi:uncharacterized protein (TIGR03000 family)
MRKLLSRMAAVVVLVSVAVLMGPGPVWAQRGGGHGGGHGGGGGGGGRAGGGYAHSSGGYGHSYGGGYGHSYGGGGYGHAYGGYGHNYGGYGHGYGYGFYRPYYGAYYLPYYSNYYSPLDYGAGFAAYSPYYGGLGASYPIIAAYGSANVPLTSDAQAAAGLSSADRPPADDFAHLQLTVPENATVLIDGTSTTQTGSVREFVTPALAPGSRYSYKIAVQYTDAQDKVVEDARDIRFRANDWFSIDFTRPQPQQQVPATPLLPKAAKEE